MKAASITLSRSPEDTNEQWQTLIKETHEAIITSFLNTAIEQFAIGSNPDGMVWVVFDVNEYFDFSHLDDKLFVIGELSGTGIWMIIDGEGYYA